MGWFGSSSPSDAKPNSQAMAQIEQQIEMMDIVFMQAVDACSKSCVPSTYKDGELNKGESVCIKRCVNKFYTTLELVGEQLAEAGAEAAAGQKSPFK